jgi:hypothetical protein
MVHSLLAALSSVSDSAIGNATVHDTVASDVVGPSTTSPRQLEQSLLVRIGQAMSLPRVVSPIQARRQQTIFDNISVSTPRPSPPLPVSSIIGNITSSFAMLMSPQRRRSSGDTSSAANASAPIVTSPRGGFDSKRRRNNTPTAITDFLGWGICTI